MNIKSFAKNMFDPLPAEIIGLLNKVPGLIDKTFPLPGRFRLKLPANAAELSRLLTSGRGERKLAYLNQPALLSAYLRYFLPWNLYRLCRLLHSLNLPLSANDRISDLGCGPLTFAAALWISRPELRTMPLEIQCIDISGPALDAGKKIFAALAGENAPWKITTIRADVSSAKAKPAALVCAINVFNEMYGDIAHNSGERLLRNAVKTASLLKRLGGAGASLLLVEPGIPRCGEFLSALRFILLQKGYQPLAPCLHSRDCPFPGGKSAAGKARWCHFAFETDDAPQELHTISIAAGLPKERAVLSFLLAAPAKAGKKHTEADISGSFPARIISDLFPLPNGYFGRYGCSEHGLIMLTGTKNAITAIPSGALAGVISVKGKTDAKSGAIIGVRG
ncbi:MAG: rRNA methyltransferase [Treponema sp.]|nr:rRNA methyltransferase [Treponema sp.]